MSGELDPEGKNFNTFLPFYLFYLYFCHIEEL